MPKTKNIIIFLAIGVVFVLIYVFYIKASPNDTAILVSSLPSTDTSSGAMTGNGDSSITEGFLTLLLNVKNIKLNDAIFSDNAFNSLHDSGITLTPDGTEGRPNPFAPLGSENIATPITP